MRTILNCRRFNFEKIVLRENKNEKIKNIFKNCIDNIKNTW